MFPVVCEIVPPYENVVGVAPTRLKIVPVEPVSEPPDAVSVPLTLSRFTADVALPLLLTLPSVIDKGVKGVVGPWISSAAPPVALIVPALLETVIEPVCSIETSALPLFVVIPRLLNDTPPEFPAVELPRLTPIPEVVLLSIVVSPNWTDVVEP